MEVALLKERHEAERRVALVPRDCARLVESGVPVRMESGAGEAAGIPDSAYADVGVAVHASPDSALADADVLPAVRWPALLGSGRLPEPVESGWADGALLLSLLEGAPEALEAIARRRGSALALERVPRITRAQAMDVLSSQATAAGYAAVLHGATLLPRFLPMLTTAAGTIPPARVLVLGAGVAGLQAIATARRLGAQVTGYDIRPAALEQIRSLGAAALETPSTSETEDAGGYAKALPASDRENQLRFLAETVRGFDLVITTAQIPGRPAPLLLDRAAVAGMKPGSVIVDLAGESGGNCELSVAGETVREGGVLIDAPTDLPSRVALHASEMFSRNIVTLLRHLQGETGDLRLDPSDPITGAILVLHDGRIPTVPDA